MQKLDFIQLVEQRLAALEARLTCLRAFLISAIQLDRFIDGDRP